MPERPSNSGLIRGVERPFVGVLGSSYFARDRTEDLRGTLRLLDDGPAGELRRFPDRMVSFSVPVDSRTRITRRRR